MLLTTPRSYRMPAFHKAAEKLGVDVVVGLDLPAELADQWPDCLAMDFSDEATAVATIEAFAAEKPLAAILAVDDSGSLLAAAASKALRLPHNRPGAALAARDKFIMRQMLSGAGIRSPRFAAYDLSQDAAEIATQIDFPVVVKPLNLNGSRGVMRANSADEFVNVVERLRHIVRASSGEEVGARMIVESFIPGVEVAVEGLINQGHFHMLALFDKPDPLDGPFFEETIYVTPSRLPSDLQESIRIATSDAAMALGLTGGPVHAELRLNEAGPWIVEIAGRSIGGKCSDVLHFGIDESLEELIMQQACGLPLDLAASTDGASGVMMIPIPAAGLLRKVAGVEAAEAVLLIESVEISAPLNYPLVPLPEGDSYLGFIFSRGETAEQVEAALRQAHTQLRFTIDPIIELQVV